jgi:hypothetical protein
LEYEQTNDLAVSDVLNSHSLVSHNYSREYRSKFRLNISNMYAGALLTTEFCYFQEVMTRKNAVTVKRMNYTAQCEASALVFRHGSYVTVTETAMMG